MATIRRSPSNQNAMTPVPNTMLPKLGVQSQKLSVSNIGLKLQSMGLGYIYNPMGSGDYGPRTNIVTDANRYKGPTQIPRIGTKISNISTYVPGKKYGM
jgi:hypothetical protein